MLSVAALLLHAALLGPAGWGPAGAPIDAQAAPRWPVMQVRTIEALPADGRSPIEPATLAHAPLIEPAAPRPSRPAKSPTRARAVRAEAAGVARPAGHAVAGDDEFLLASADVAGTPAGVAPKPRLEAAPAAPAASTPAAAAGTDDAIPHYRTQMPRAATLRYQVSKGALHGTGELHWNPQGERYDITLESKLAGWTLLTQVSSGVFDADGIAPVRFTDTRLRRSTVAANFRRDVGKISFSGSSEEFSLWPGTQDRVSWMVQLAAIVAAHPDLRQPGAKVAMHVVGANADASVWAFKCVGTEAVRTDLGPVKALKYVREPRGPYDTTAQAWLDPTHHFLPARATLSSGPNDEGYELRLQDVEGTP